MFSSVVLEYSVCGGRPVFTGLVAIVLTDLLLLVLIVLPTTGIQIGTFRILRRYANH
jgi:hypothetical protein